VYGKDGSDRQPTLAEPSVGRPEGRVRPTYAVYGKDRSDRQHPATLAEPCTSSRKVVLASGHYWSESMISLASIYVESYYTQG
jgi:hypothetical protein